MEWDKLAFWLAFTIVMSVIVCATIYGSVNSVNQTDIERAVIACDEACPYEDGHCIIECVKALDIEMKLGESNNEHLP